MGDLFGRGVDIEKVNIVINYDMPPTRTPTSTAWAGRGGSAPRGWGSRSPRPRRSKRFWTTFSRGSRSKSRRFPMRLTPPRTCRSKDVCRSRTYLDENPDGDEEE